MWFSGAVSCPDIGHGLPVVSSCCLMRHELLTAIHRQQTGHFSVSIAKPFQESGVSGI